MFTFQRSGGVGTLRLLLQRVPRRHLTLTLVAAIERLYVAVEVNRESRRKD